MKNINIYILFLALFSMVACEEDYEAPFPVSDVKWYTSMPTATEYFVLQDDMMGFIDASQGALSHEWNIQEGSYFLKEGFVLGDSLANFIDETKGFSSTDENVCILFSESGRKTVQLKNTFAEKVTFNGVRPIEAVEKDGVWVIDTTFTVDVYAPLKPAYKVCKVIDNPDGTVSAGELVLEVGPEDEVDQNLTDDWESLEVEVGERLMFIDLTKDEHEELVQPDSRTWTIRNNNQAQVFTDSVAVAYFNVYGYQTTGLGSLKSSRNGAGAPSAEVQKAIPLKLKVVQSSKPFTYADGAMWTSATTFAFNVSGEVSTLGTNPEAGFTVHVTNTAKGIDADFTVAGVSYEATNKTRLTITLDQPIYADDVVTVSFDATGTDIESVDERPFVSFDAQTVAFPSSTTNEFIDNGAGSGFETGGAGLNKAFCPQYWVGGQDAANPEWSRVEAPVYEGTASMKFNADLATLVRKKLSWMQFQKGVDLKAGSYKISHRVYIEAGSTIKTFKTDLAPKAGGSWPVMFTLTWDIADLPRGEWVTITQNINITSDISENTDQFRYQYLMSDTDNPGVNGVQTMYFDGFELIKVAAGFRP